MCQLMTIVARGGDTRIVSKSEAVRTVFGKFKRMKDRLDKQREPAVG